MKRAWQYFFKQPYHEKLSDGTSSFYAKLLAKSIPLSEAIQKKPKIGEAAKQVEDLYGRKIYEPRVLLKSGLSSGGNFATANGEVIAVSGRKREAVHELAHSQDLHKDSPVKKLIAPQEDHVFNIMKLTNRLYLEGRAVYAESCGKKQRRFANIPFLLLAAGTATSVLCLADIILNPQNYDLKSIVKWTIDAVDQGAALPLQTLASTFLEAAAKLARNLLPFLAIEFISHGALYWIFHNSICQIAKKVGNPIKAFRISGMKVPTTLREIFFPSRFYAEEIAAAKLAGKLAGIFEACQCPPEFEERKKALRHGLEALPQYAKFLADGYARLLAEEALAQGEVRVYLVGGVLKGQKVRTDQDIDLILTVEQPKNAPSFFMTNQQFSSSPCDSNGARCHLWLGGVSELDEQKARTAMEKFKELFAQANRQFSMPPIIDIVNSNQPLDNYGREHAMLLYSTKSGFAK